MCIRDSYNEHASPSTASLGLHNSTVLSIKPCGDYDRPKCQHRLRWHYRMYQGWLWLQRIEQRDCNFREYQR